MRASSAADVIADERADVQPLDPDQARTLLHTVAGHRLEALFTVALAIGLRPGEALGLRWEDVDLEPEP